MKKLARASYGVYYVHQLVVMHVVWFLRPWDAPLPVKYGSMAVLSLLICFMFSAGVLSRIPPFKETAAK